MASRQISERIIKLLNLARSSSSRHESETALSMAKRLMEEHSLNEGDAHLYAEGIVEQFFPYGWVQRPRWVPNLPGVIARHFNCRHYIGERHYVWYSRYHGEKAFYESSLNGKMARHETRAQEGFVFIGFEVDVEVAGHAYDFARHTINKLTNAFGRQTRKRNKYVARMSYAEGLVEGLDYALHLIGKESIADDMPPAYTGTGLMRIDDLVEKKFGLIDSYVEEKLDLRNYKDRDAKSDRACKTKGQVDGMSIRLSRGISGGNGGPLALGSNNGGSNA